MKLLVISHSCATPENQDLYARIQRQTGWHITLLLPRLWQSEYGLRVAERLPGFQANLRPLPVALNGNIPLHFYLSSLSRIFAEERPDLIFVQHESHAVATMQAFAANRRSGRAPIAFKNDQNLVKRYPWPIRVGERFVYREAAFALAGARAAADVMRQKGYRGPLEVGPYSIDAARYRPPDSDRALRESLVIGYVGRLVPEKGVDTIIRALPMTSDDVRALIVGSGPAESGLRSLASELRVADRVEWRGYIEHGAVAQVYGEMDLLILPSKTTANWREQFGRVVIEALACGVPVCSSDSGEPPALIEETGGGWIFPEDKPNALAAFLRWADGNGEELRRTGKAGRARVLESFSADSAAASFVDVVRRNGLERRRPGRSP